MSDKLSPAYWESYFTEEALMTEELVASGDFAFLNQSKIKIALENKILSWKKYTSWIQSKYNYARLKENISPLEITNLLKIYNENKKTFKHYGIWSDDLVALQLWDDQLIILGLIPTDQIESIPNALFILCPPVVLNQLKQTEKIDVEKSDDSDTEASNTTTESDVLLEIDQNISTPLSFNFSKISTNPQTSNSVWDLIEKNHTLHSDQARKQFEAYVVLRIVDKKTQLFKMDEDLIKENLNADTFIYDLNSVNPFAKVFRGETSDSFSLDQLGLSVLDFKFACVTPLKVGTEILGFLVGFKITEPHQNDVSVLESISAENTVAA